LNHWGERDVRKYAAVARLFRKKEECGSEGKRTQAGPDKLIKKGGGVIHTGGARPFRRENDV